MPDNTDTSYINSSDYDTLKVKLNLLKDILEDQFSKADASRKLRYAEVDIESERETGRFLPDELYIPVHIIDTNIRREQSPYVQYITQSPRAVICRNLDDRTIDMALLENDLTDKLRYEGWQLSQFANIDGFQSNGYGVMEVIQDLKNPGEVGHENVQYSDFAFISDTKDIQKAEITARAYYYTKTALVDLCGDPNAPDPDNDWERTQVDMLIKMEPTAQQNDITSTNQQDRSLYKVVKYMFRINGIVNVAWGQPLYCSNWLRKAKPLRLGKMEVVQQPIQPQASVNLLIPQQQQQPALQPVPEKKFPYVIFPYLISENDTISQLKGRVFLDQDLQEAVASLISSLCTKARRSAGGYFSKDTSDPNDDLMMQKNIFLRNGCLVNSKITSFELSGPDPSLFSAVNQLIALNQNETSQVNWAVNNRKDSRKTAEEVRMSAQQQQLLSTVQVVLFAIGLTQMYRLMVDIITSRVLAGLIVVSPQLKQMYQMRYSLKPSGDIDVIERQQLIQSMTQSWSVIQNTPAAPIFLCDLLELMFPERATKYVQIIMQAQQQAQSAQAQQQQQMMQIATQMAQSIINLAKHPEFFSDVGRLHALPVIEQGATQLESMQKQTGNGQQTTQTRK